MPRIAHEIWGHCASCDSPIAVPIGGGDDPPPRIFAVDEVGRPLCSACWSSSPAAAFAATSTRSTASSSSPSGVPSVRAHLVARALSSEVACESPTT